jgi:hypothetical protein
VPALALVLSPVIHSLPRFAGCWVFRPGFGVISHIALVFMPYDFSYFYIGYLRPKVSGCPKPKAQSPKPWWVGGGGGGDHQAVAVAQSAPILLHAPAAAAATRRPPPGGGPRSLGIAGRSPAHTRIPFEQKEPDCDCDYLLSALGLLPLEHTCWLLVAYFN